MYQVQNQTSNFTDLPL